MVTEKQYLEAQKIVDVWNSQLNQSRVIPRYFVDIRVGCGAVRDKWHESYDEDYPGLHSNTPDITEGEASHLFERDDIFNMYQYYIDTVPYMFTTGLEAFNGLLQANGIVFENPFGKIHPHHPNYTSISESVDGYLDRSEEWQEAQAKVWDKERTYLFIKID